MIESFIDSALILDDKENEITALKALLEENDVWVKYYNPEDLKSITKPIKNRKVVFIDLHIDESQELKPNIALLRNYFKKLLGENFGTYGIIIWTKHPDEIETFKTKIQSDTQYTLPLFIVGLDKTKYLQRGDYKTLFGDINSALEKNVAAKFFIDWGSSINKGRDTTITNIYSLVKDYQLQDDNLKYILYQLAKNYTGIPSEQIEGYPIYIDTFKAFNDLLHFETTNNIGKEKEYETLFSQSEDIQFKGDKQEKERIFCSINSQLLLDAQHLQQQFVLPGNVYEILEENNPLIVDKTPENSSKIIIEITPPCDFSQNKKAFSRVIGGFIGSFTKSQKEKYKSDYYYKEIWPLEIEGKEGPQMIIFDFRYFSSINEQDLKDKKKYKLIFRAKDKLFADILQKLSSHIARLGLAIIHS